ncbi:hypothetical protein C5167_011937 [Papaver somniferum]|uniref:Sulfotransferase n=1 Tax=Papaver somniferum TaxID=3469 RepID=A0A4Y7IY37_PAPSO|nr:hypothetical protein C5167_011937 [Papaver somniferum]
MATSDNEKPFDLSGNSSARDGFGYFAFHQYQGFWFYAKGIENVKDFQQNFKALDTDIVIATLPKAGTTWLKALAYAIVNRPRYNHLEHELDSPSRLTATHVPYPSLPESIRSCINCKEDNGYRAPLSIEEALEFFCSGVSIFGPFWDHILGYWKESLENPHRGLFLKYEDLKKEPKTQARRLAEFMGYGFSTEDESRGVIEEILHLCSFQNLKDLDVNKNGNFTDRVKNIEFYRKGEVADWKNHLRLPMVERLDRLVNDKFQGSGLVFEN